MLNAVLIGLETDFLEKFHWDVVENMFLVCLTVELLPSLMISRNLWSLRTTSKEDSKFNRHPVIPVAVSMLVASCRILSHLDASCH
jgi:uncharacterized membrane protein